MAYSTSRHRPRKRERRFWVLLVGVVCCLQTLVSWSPTAGLVQRTGPPGKTAIIEGEVVDVPQAFLSKVFAAAAQGTTAAVVAAMLSAVTEPIVNRLLVRRMTLGQAVSELTFASVLNFFVTTLFTNILKFPIFEVINAVMSFTSLSGAARGSVTGWLFCTIMLPVTNYRFRKSMGWSIRPSIFYQAYVPTVARDIVYGAARGVVGSSLEQRLTPSTNLQQAMVFGLTVWCACVISSPGNEWRGYTLQPEKDKKSFREYFKPASYARSTGIGACIMGLSLMSGRLIMPFAEVLFAYCQGHLGLLALLVLAIVLLRSLLTA